MRISFVKALLHRASLEVFFTSLVEEMELVTDLEISKRREVQHNRLQIEQHLGHLAGFFTLLCGGYFTVRPQYEWVARQKLLYLSKIPRRVVYLRGVFALLTGVGVAYRKTVAKHLMPLYYADLLADLQLSPELELGYWARQFALKL